MVLAGEGGGAVSGRTAGFVALPGGATIPGLGADRWRCARGTRGDAPVTNKFNLNRNRPPKPNPTSPYLAWCFLGFFLPHSIPTPRPGLSALVYGPPPPCHLRGLLAARHAACALSSTPRLSVPMRSLGSPFVTPPHSFLLSCTPVCVVPPHSRGVHLPGGV